MHLNLTDPEVPADHVQVGDEVNGSIADRIEDASCRTVG